jgi:hypothetical protein
MRVLGCPTEEATTVATADRDVERPVLESLSGQKTGDSQRVPLWFNLAHADDDEVDRRHGNLNESTAEVSITSWLVAY